VILKASSHCGGRSDTRASLRIPETTIFPADGRGRWDRPSGSRSEPRIIGGGPRAACPRFKRDHRGFGEFGFSRGMEEFRINALDTVSCTR